MQPPHAHLPTQSTPRDPRGPDEGLSIDPSLLRLIDANANRASEGMRVVEDYLRFSLEDGHLAERCKAMRHALTDTLSNFGTTARCLVRDVAGDPGRTVSTEQELVRSNVSDVLAANLRRIQQALRSLEEWAKLDHVAAALRLESLRYEAYELESMIQRRQFWRRDLDGVQLYVLIDGGRDAADFCRRSAELIRSGVPLVQLRDKRLTDRELVERARTLIEATRGTGTRVVINDRPDIALVAGAAGVHLGQDELAVRDARRLLGPNALIGVSTHELSQSLQAVRDGASYIGAGPTFPSATKSFAEFPGLAYLRQVAAELQCPTFAIGGIELERLDDVLDQGVSRVAVSSAIWNAASVSAACQSFMARLTAVRVRAVAASEPVGNREE